MGVRVGTITRKQYLVYRQSYRSIVRKRWDLKNAIMRSQTFEDDAELYKRIYRVELLSSIIEYLRLVLVKFDERFKKVK